jgi:hypothetical protein
LQAAKASAAAAANTRGGSFLATLFTAFLSAP